MAASLSPNPLKQELVAAHALALECAARADCFLGAAAAPGANERASLEAVRMAGLAARLMERVAQVVPRLRGRLDLGAPIAACAAAAKGPPSTPAASSAPKVHAAPGQRRGCLKNGNPCGDYLKSPRCGARTRAGCACRQPAMANGRCRLHGGLSTGPRTTEGLARCRAARLRHGFSSRELIGLRRRAARAARRLRGLTRALSAGHGVHRSNSCLPVGARGASSAGAQSLAGSRANDPRARAARPCRERPNGALSAGHGVDRSDSIHDRDHGGHRAGMIARNARQDRPDNPTSVISVSSAVNPSSPKSSSAGHGEHRSFRDRLRYPQPSA